MNPNCRLLQNLHIIKNKPDKETSCKLNAFCGCQSGRIQMSNIVKRVRINHSFKTMAFKPKGVIGRLSFFFKQNT